jgi:hypothetical protein
MESLIRPVAAKDFPAVADLLAELGRPQLTPETEDAAREVYLRHTSRQDTASLVAECDDRVVGFLSLEFRDRLNRAHPQAWIPDLTSQPSTEAAGLAKPCWKPPSSVRANAAAGALLSSQATSGKRPTGCT